MVRNVVKLCCALAVLALAGPAAAQADQRRVGLLLRFGLEGGGDTVEELVYTNGDRVKVKAGGLVLLSGGLLYRGDAWALEGTIGYKVDDATADNGKIQFSRVPLEVIAAYKAGNHRIGAGPALHLSPKYTCDLDGGLCGPVTEVPFKNSAGAVLQYVYGAPVGNSGFELGVRVTIIKYVAKDYPLEYKGNSFGAFIGGWL